VTPFLLYLLACIDAACCGYRDAGGRNARIDKRAYYRRALGRGLLWGQGAVIIVAVALAVLVWLAPDRSSLLLAALAAGRRMLEVYLPYAALIGLAGLLRLAPSVDLRCLTSVLIFGPLLLLRPVVAAIGVVWAVWRFPRPEIILLGALILSLMLSLEGLLGLTRQEKQP